MRNIGSKENFTLACQFVSALSENEISYKNRTHYTENHYREKSVIIYVLHKFIELMELTGITIDCNGFHKENK